MVTRSKKEYGLGLRRLDNMNKACIMKLGWKLHNNPNELWCKVLKGKYNYTNPLDHTNHKGIDSSLWKIIKKIEPYLYERGSRSIMDGRSID